MIIVFLKHLYVYYDNVVCLENLILGEINIISASIDLFVCILRHTSRSLRAVENSNLDGECLKGEVTITIKPCLRRVALHPVHPQILPGAGPRKEK